MTVWEPDSDLVDLEKSGLGKKKASAASDASVVDRDRMFYICMLVYVLVYAGICFTLLIMIYIEKQKPCLCQV